MASKSPKGPERREDLIVQKAGEELIVYDQASHRAHSLNRTAALVFEKLDGKTDLKGVALHVGKAVGRPHQKEIVTNAVRELAAADLLKPGAALPRRSMLRGLAAGLLPAVVTIAVPKAAQAMSCIGDELTCVPLVDVCCDPSRICFDIGFGSPPVPDFVCHLT